MVSYNKIVDKAKSIKKNVETNYKLDESSKYSYYIAKALIKPKHDVNNLNFETAPKPTGTKISQQVSKSDYVKLAWDLVQFVESKKRLPNYLMYGQHKIRCRLYVYMFAKVLVYYETNNKLPSEVNVNFKAFTKPTETGNSVYDYFVKKNGYAPKTIDELLDYVKKHFKYLSYFNDYKSNKEVIDTKSGNCTDLLQWLINMSKAMGYDAKCIHVKCRKSGTGHVRGKFKHSKHTNGAWIDRDPAAVADNGAINSIWCKDGIILAENPSWFMDNLNR